MPLLHSEAGSLSIGCGQYSYIEHPLLTLKQQHGARTWNKQNKNTRTAADQLGIFKQIEMNDTSQ